MTFNTALLKVDRVYFTSMKCNLHHLFCHDDLLYRKDRDFLMIVMKDGVIFQCCCAPLEFCCAMNVLHFAPITNYNTSIVSICCFCIPSSLNCMDLVLYQKDCYVVSSWALKV